MSEHEAIQPPAKFIRHHKDDRECPSCGGRMVRRARQCRNCACPPRPTIAQPEDQNIRHIPLTRDMYAIVDSTDYDWLMQWKWCANKSARKNGEARYYALRINCKAGVFTTIIMHRLIMGVTDPEIDVDHKNPLDTLNNTRGNLRLATTGQNQANRLYQPNVSGYKGVTVLKKKLGRRAHDFWRGAIYVNGVRIVSPVFSDPIPAAHWYDAMALKYFGEFARINFPTK